ncbi:MAG: hypothetical protein GWP05_06320 [Anaerolineaceae bacterium]|nr:hypothetical protein [Anaerolineaceae bacterium]
MGLSEFFAGHEAGSPRIGINPGWSSAGLATLRPGGGAQAWLAWGDLLSRPEVWVVKTDPPRPFPATIGCDYRVRHQVIFAKGVNRVRFRIWPDGRHEPDTWLCDEADAPIPDTFTKWTGGSFGLFQNEGLSTEWFDIYVRALASGELYQRKKR